MEIEAKVSIPQWDEDSAEQQIIEQASQKLVQQISKEALTEAVKTASQEASLQASKAISEAMESGFKKTNMYGEPTGESRPLRQYIVENAREYMQAKVRKDGEHAYEAKLEHQKQMKAIESTRNQKRRSLFEAQDQLDLQRQELIGRIEGKLVQNAELKTLFLIRWTLA